MKSYHNLARHEGNRQLFEVVEMGVISSLWEAPLHIHAEGLRGTGKTTVMRAVKDLLLPMERIKGCLYNCHPHHPHCPHHRNLNREEVEAVGTEVIPRPFLEISHTAKTGTVAGSIDLARITDTTRSEAALLPGIIPQAHRGIIFIDEINRLADTAPEITDILLDVMGTKPGRIQIEETGLPVVEIPVQVSVWAASNPDEEPGPLQEIRRQLSDRFDLVIDMGRSKDPDAIAQILIQSETARKNPYLKPVKTEPAEKRYSQEMEDIAHRYRNLEMPDFLRNYIARTYVKYDLESLRAIEAVQHGALLSCALRRGEKVLISDILKIIPLALQHRTDRATLAKIMAGSDNSFSYKEEKGNGSDSNNNRPTTGILSSQEDTETLSAEAPAKAMADKSLFAPLKQLLGSRPKPANADEITTSPPGQARRITEVDGDNLLKTETQLRS
ncbi:MAG: magnesium chelatase [Clostridia bacterium]|nr:magnesium chelatase [Clostridia bacterium]